MHSSALDSGTTGNWQVSPRRRAGAGRDGDRPSRGRAGARGLQQAARRQGAEARARARRELRRDVPRRGAPGRAPAHPNIVQTIEVGSEGSRHYMVMEFLDGRSLHRIVRRFRRPRRLPGRRAPARHRRGAPRACTTPTSCATSTAQPLGIVHRDVSPLNVFVTFDGQAKVARLRHRQVGATRRSRRRPACSRGASRTWPPSRPGDSSVDRRADVYSAGVMIWEAAAGPPPLAGHERRGDPRAAAARGPAAAQRRATRRSRGPRGDLRAGAGEAPRGPLRIGGGPPRGPRGAPRSPRRRDVDARGRAPSSGASSPKSGVA